MLNKKNKTIFLNNKFIQKTLSDTFPGYCNVCPEDIIVYSYIFFRTQYLIEVVLKYKQYYIPMRLDIKVSFDNNIEKLKFISYSYNLSLSNNKYTSNMLSHLTPFNKEEFEFDTFKDFFGKRFDFFENLYNSFYSKKQSINLKETVVSDLVSEDKIFFDLKLEYLDGLNDHFFNIYSCQKEVDNFPKKVHFEIKTMNCNHSYSIPYNAFMECYNSKFNTLSEFIRYSYLDRYKLDDELIPNFDNYIELIVFFDEHKDKIFEVRDMSKI